MQETGNMEVKSENKKRKKSTKRTEDRTIAERRGDVAIEKKEKRVRKPKRGNRGGAGRRRLPGKKNAGLLQSENKVGIGNKRQRTDESGKVNGGGKDAERRNRKKKERNLSQGNPEYLKDASDDERLEESMALLESKKSKFKSKSKGDSLTTGAAIEEDEAEKGPVKTCFKPVTFLDKMRARLSGGRFRMLNESLYTCKGHEAFELFKKDRGAFDLYHTGYQEQMSRWPVLPVTVVTDWLKARSPKLVVADFGCGDARLAKNVSNKVFSMDLVSGDPSVIACNMAQTPLDSSSMDVAVFCLSLMGTDYPTFLEEAYRVLKPRGWLLIAEVKSRLDAVNGGADPQKFISSLKALGFALDSQDASNKMFHMFYFQKEKEGIKDGAKRKIKWPELKPCIYKRR